MRKLVNKCIVKFVDNMAHIIQDVLTTLLLDQGLHVAIVMKEFIKENVI